MNWKTIETAPINKFDAEKWFCPGENILLWLGHYCVIGQFSYTKKGKGRWKSWYGVVYPTHWMELPIGPVTGDVCVFSAEES